MDLWLERDSARRKNDRLWDNLVRKMDWLLGEGNYELKDDGSSFNLTVKHRVLVEKFEQHPELFDADKPEVTLKRSGY